MTIEAGIGVGLGKDPLQSTVEAIRQARRNISSEKIDLAFVFTSAELAHPNILKTINDLLGATAIVGCSGAAIISNQGIFQHGIAIMLVSLPEGIHFNIGYTKDIVTKGSLPAGEELGEKLLYGFRNIHRNLSLIFSDGLMKDKTNFLYGLQEKLGQSFPLVGACASDNKLFLKTYVYFDREVSSNAACGLLFGGKLNFGLGIKHGWKPLGKPRYVTKSDTDILYKIDDAPAAKIYEEYLDCNLTELKKQLKHISVLYPIGIHLPGEDEYLLRNVMSVQEDGSLILQGEIAEGAQIRLMIGTKESCLTATKEAVDEAKKGLQNQRSDFVLVFDSISRYILLGRQASRELQIIKEGLGQDTPIIGIYTYGEQAPLKAVDYHGKTYFHNQTITVLAMRGLN